MNRWLPRTYLTLVYLLLYVPIVVLVVFSFNDSRTGYEWGGLSLRWYEALRGAWVSLEPHHRITGSGCRGRARCCCG